MRTSNLKCNVTVIKFSPHMGTCRESLVNIIVNIPIYLDCTLVHGLRIKHGSILQADNCLSVSAYSIRHHSRIAYYIRGTQRSEPLLAVQTGGSQCPQELTEINSFLLSRLPSRLL